MASQVREGGIRPGLDGGPAAEQRRTGVLQLCGVYRQRALARPEGQKKTHAGGVVTIFLRVIDHCGSRAHSEKSDRPHPPGLRLEQKNQAES